MHTRFIGDHALCRRWYGYALNRYRALENYQTCIIRPDIGVEIVLRKEDDLLGEIRITAAQKSEYYSTRYVFFDVNVSSGTYVLVVVIVDNKGKIGTATMPLKGPSYNIADEILAASFDLADPNAVYFLTRDTDLVVDVGSGGRDSEQRTDQTYKLFRTNINKNKKGILFFDNTQEVTRFTYIYKHQRNISHGSSTPYGWQGIIDKYLHEYTIDVRDIYINGDVFKCLYAYDLHEYTLIDHMYGRAYGANYTEGPESWEAGYGYEDIGSFPRTAVSWYIAGTHDKCYWNELFFWDRNTLTGISHNSEGMVYPICILNEEDFMVAEAGASFHAEEVACGRYYFLGGWDDDVFGTTSYRNLEFRPVPPFKMKIYSSDTIYQQGQQAADTVPTLYEADDSIYDYEFYDGAVLRHMHNDEIWQMFKDTPALALCLYDHDYSVTFNIRFNLAFSYAFMLFEFEHFAFVSKSSEVDLDFLSSFYVGYLQDKDLVEAGKKDAILRGVLCVDWLDYGYGGLSWSNPIFFDGFHTFPIGTLNTTTQTGKLQRLPGNQIPGAFDFQLEPFNEAIVYPTAMFSGTYLFRNLFNDTDGAYFLSDMILVDKKRDKFLLNGKELLDNIKPITL